MRAIKHYLRDRLSYEMRRTLKTWKRRSANLLRRPFRHRVSLGEMRDILTDDLGLKPGDRVMVSSSFGNLNAGFTPRELVELLKEIVTGDGLIVMPYYPPGNSLEWARTGRVFDMDVMPSSMGALTNALAASEGAIKSNHPTKAVCAWGKEAGKCVSGHENASTPFHTGSPYAWLMERESKSVGLGLLNIPIYHACEDLPEDVDECYYLPKRYRLTVINRGDKKTISTLVHDSGQKFNEEAGTFIQHMGLTSHRAYKCGFSVAYSVDNRELLTKSHEYFKAGNTRMIRNNQANHSTP